MEKNLKILVPYDFSKAAETALEYVKGFVAKIPDAEIILGYVKPCSDVELCSSMLSEVVEDFNRYRTNPVSWELRTGKFMQGFVDIVDSRKIDLIFMGTNSLHEGRLTTRASELALEVQCPVFVIPKGLRTFHLERIGLLMGSDPIHNKALLERLLRVAREFNARVSVLTVKDEEANYGYRPEDEVNEDAIAYYLESFYSHHVFIEGPDLGKAIFDYTNRNNIDLLAILPRNHVGDSRRSEGRLTRYLCEHTEAPLLVIDL